MITWVVGGGGLLGSALVRSCEHTFASVSVPWDDPQEAAAVLEADAIRFQQQAGAGAWAVIWAAGAATVSTSAEAAAPERAVLEALLTSLRDHRPAGAGAVFIASSAGGVYAGSSDPPFSIETRPVPTSAYGELKLAQERIAAELLEGICPVVIGRISNLYGPGQNLGKLQGLISRLALSAITRQPINIFVSLDTIRDYIYVDDAAAATHTAIAEALATGEPQAHTIVIASGQPATIGQLIRIMKEISKRRVPVALGTHPSAHAQAVDLRLEPSISLSHTTPLSVGMKAVRDDILALLQQAALDG